MCVVRNVPRRHLCERKDYRVFRQKTVNIRVAVGNTLRRRLVCECKTATSSHLHQFNRGVLETSERAMSSVIENDLNMKTHRVKAILRLASSSSRGSGSCDKNSNSR